MGTATTEKHHDYDAEMKLPEGKTCSDCRNFRFCKGFLGLKGTETKCDW